jgi:dihydrofolate synthase/folylpolyglutamate synthase
MNFTEATTYLYSLGHETLAMKLGLESIRRLCRQLGNPQQQIAAVHIAGTNGKGSTSAMVEAIALQAGLRTGLYTSPHLEGITERIRVNGRNISQPDFARLAGVVRQASEQLITLHKLPAPPTFFEQVTAIALLWFRECQVDLAIMEVGLGGRLDATNVCVPLVCAITPISTDHQRYLGSTTVSIAMEKAGIIKSDAPVVLAQQDDWETVRSVVVKKCRENAAPLIDPAESGIEPEIYHAGNGQYSFRYHTHSNSYNIQLNLAGRHQVINACTAILIAEQLQRRGMKLQKKDIEEGLNTVHWAGRLEMIEPATGRSRFLLDGAHNAAGARVLREFLLEHCRQPLTLIFAVMTDKSLDEIAMLLFPLAQTVIVTHVDNQRAADPKMIVERFSDQGWRIQSTDTAAEAIEIAERITPTDGLICVCGSLYLIGEVKGLLK